MDDNTDYMVFRENDEYNITNEIQKPSDSEPENDNLDNEPKIKLKTIKIIVVKYNNLYNMNFNYKTKK